MPIAGLHGPELVFIFEEVPVFQIGWNLLGVVYVLMAIGLPNQNTIC